MSNIHKADICFDTIVGIALNKYAIDEFGQMQRLLDVRKNQRKQSYLVETSNLSDQGSMRKIGADVRKAYQGTLVFDAEWTDYWLLPTIASEQDIIYCDKLDTALRFLRRRRLLFAINRVNEIIAARAARVKKRRLIRLAEKQLDQQAREALTKYIESGEQSSLFQKAINGDAAAERARIFICAQSKCSSISNRIRAAWFRNRGKEIENEARATPGVIYQPATSGRRHITRWKYGDLAG